jgi:hypothetical protein
MYLYIIVIFVIYTLTQLLSLTPVLPHPLHRLVVTQLVRHWHADVVRVLHVVASLVHSARVSWVHHLKLLRLGWLLQKRLLILNVVIEIYKYNDIN